MVQPVTENTTFLTQVCDSDVDVNVAAELIALVRMLAMFGSIAKYDGRPSNG